MTNNGDSMGITLHCLSCICCTCVIVAEAIVIDKEPGTFVVRDSTSFRGSFGLAMKVDQVPVNISPTGQPGKQSLSPSEYNTAAQNHHHTHTPHHTVL